MVKVIDSEVVIKAYFKKYRTKTQLKYAELKNIRYNAEPKLGAYIDITYASLKRVQVLHRGAIAMDDVQITIIGDSLRKVSECEKRDVKLLESYL